MKAGDRVRVLSVVHEHREVEIEDPFTGSRVKVLRPVHPEAVVVDGPLNGDVPDVLSDGVFWLVAIDGDLVGKVPVDERQLERISPRPGKKAA